MRRLIRPGHDEVAAAQFRHRRVVLVIGGVTVDRKCVALNLAIAVEALADNAVPRRIAGIPVTVGFPGNDETAVAQSGNRWMGLVIVRIGGELPVDPELFTKRLTAIGITLAINIIIPAVAVLIITLPDHHITASGQLIDRCV